MYHIKNKPKYAALVVIFSFATILEIVKAEIRDNNGTIPRKNVNSCECILNNCGCCQHIEWDIAKINGTICTNITYLEHDYGFTVTVTYNNYPIINETLSARNPPPICFGEDIIENFPVEGCFRIYDININGTDFHCCFELEAKFAKLNIYPLHLGCFNYNHTNIPSSNVSWTSRIDILQITVYLSIFSIILSRIIIS